MGMSAPPQSFGACLLFSSVALMPGKNQNMMIKAKTPIISFSQICIYAVGGDDTAERRIFCVRLGVQDGRSRAYINT